MSKSTGVGLGSVATAEETGGDMVAQMSSASTLKTPDEVNQLISTGMHNQAWSVIFDWMAEAPDEARNRVEESEDGWDFIDLLGEVWKTEKQEKDFLGPPMFIYPPVNKRNKNDGGATSKTNVSRDDSMTVLRKYPCFNVRFKGWQGLDGVLQGYEDPAPVFFGGLRGRQDPQPALTPPETDKILTI